MSFGSGIHYCWGLPSPGSKGKCVSAACSLASRTELRPGRHRASRLDHTPGSHPPPGERDAGLNLDAPKKEASLVRCSSSTRSAEDRIVSIDLFAAASWGMWQRRPFDRPLDLGQAPPLGRVRRCGVEARRRCGGRLGRVTSWSTSTRLFSKTDDLIELATRSHVAEPPYRIVVLRDPVVAWRAHRWPSM